MIFTSFWKDFLKKWNEDILTLLKESHSKIYFSDIAKEGLDKGWLGFPGVREEEILAAEKRLNLKLPPSYRDFLKVTNGWRQIGFDAEDTRIFPVEEIDLFSVKYGQSYNGWLAGYGEYSPVISDEFYFVYGPDQDPINIRNEYLGTAIAISEEVDSAVYLLNPHVMTSDGEWEAWFFGYTLPGAVRYRSFRDMMEGEYVRILTGMKDFLI